jgi:hypothetical protein
MALPYVKIHYENGAIGAANPSADGLLGLVVSAKAVAGTFALNNPYVLTSYDGLEALGITAENNVAAEKLIRGFYAGAGNGTRVYLMGVAETVSQSEMLDVTNKNYARKIIEVSKGEVRGIVVNYVPATGYTPTIENGLDADVYAAIINGQTLGNWAEQTWKAPIFVGVEGRNYSGVATELTDLTKMTNNRVCVLIGDSVTGTNGAAMGLLAGRIASIPVQQNIGRVKDGAVAAQTIYIADEPAERADVEGVHDKGFITFRAYTGRAGYFFTNDPLASLPSDDYHRIAWRRTIDKAYRIAYVTMLNELLDAVPVTSRGTILPAFAKNWEQLLINAIYNQMTANGELSRDPADASDRGVKATIDPEQNVISTGNIKALVRVRPFGYAEYVNVYLGFDIQQTNGNN